MSHPRHEAMGQKPSDHREPPGQFIVIEGTDKVGCTTQIDLLTTWLETAGHPVLATGLGTSSLVGSGIAQAESGHELDPITRQLLYATDVCDRLEREIMPALRAGMIVLADRYIFTLMARAIVRGIEAEWVERLYACAHMPDLVFYLDTDVDHLVSRALSGTGFGYWESGRDQSGDQDRYRSFVGYQRSVLPEYRRLVTERGFTIIDARRPSNDVFAALKAQIQSTGTIAGFPHVQSRPEASVWSSVLDGDSNEPLDDLVPLLAQGAGTNGHLEGVRG